MNFKKTEELLKKGDPTPLNKDEQEFVLRSVRETLAAGPRTNNVVANVLISMNKRLLLKVLAGALIFTSTFATAYAANSAKPGDTLFVIDRALEEIQLALIADDIKEAELKLKFAEERLEEVRAIIAEAKLQSDETAVPETAMMMKSAPASESTTQTFESSAHADAESSSDDSMERIVPASALPVQIKAAGAAKESKEVSNAVSIALEYFADVKNDFEKSKDAKHSQSLDSILDELQSDLAQLPSNTHLSIDIDEKKERVRFEVESDQEGDDKIRIRVREEDDSEDANERLRIDFKRNGKVRMEAVGGGFAGVDKADDETTETDEQDESDRGREDRGADDASRSLLQREESSDEDAYDQESNDKEDDSNDVGEPSDDAIDEGDDSSNDDGELGDSDGSDEIKDDEMEADSPSHGKKHNDDESDEVTSSNQNRNSWD